MRASPRAATVAGDYAAELRRREDAANATVYPMVRYQTNILGYVRERLGITQVLVHQLEILLAVQAGVLGRGQPGKPPPGLAVSSGQKIGKSLLAVCVALWFFECFDDAKTFLASSTEEQLRDVLWSEMARVLRIARANGTPVDGKMSTSPTGGLISTDGSRSVKALVGRDVETLAGRSGQMLLIIDEASALEASKAEALHGNMMGGGFVFMISNPTRTDGPFFDAFHSMRHKWVTFTISSEDVAAEQERLGISIQGLANVNAIRHLRELYPGDDNPFYLVRVLGRFLLNEASRAIQLHQIEAAVARLHGMVGSGRLVIGYDPAGPGDGGDEHAWCGVRGPKVEFLMTLRGLSDEEALAHTLAMLAQHRRRGEIPRIHVDTEGLGGNIYSRLRGERAHRWIHDRANGFEVSGIKASSKNVKNSSKFLRVRDELIWGVAQWLPTAGIPQDQKLHEEMHEWRWKTSGDFGLLEATPKKVVREKLGRSPDRFDSVALAIYAPRVWREPTAEDEEELDARDPAVQAAGRAHAGYQWHEPENPTEALDAFRGDGDFLDPRARRGDR